LRRFRFRRPGGLSRAILRPLEQILAPFHGEREGLPWILVPFAELGEERREMPGGEPAPQERAGVSGFHGLGCFWVPFLVSLSVGRNDELSHAKSYPALRSPEQRRHAKVDERASGIARYELPLVHEVRCESERAEGKCIERERCVERYGGQARV